MERDIEKDLLEIEGAIRSQTERNNMFTVSVLQRCYKLVSQLKEAGQEDKYREVLEEIEAVEPEEKENREQ